MQILRSDSPTDRQLKLNDAGTEEVTFEAGNHPITETMIPPSNANLNLTGANLYYPAGTTRRAMFDLYGSDITIIGGSYDGNVQEQEYNSKQHIFRSWGAVRPTLHRMRFKNLAGDAIYLSRSFDSGPPYISTKQPDIFAIRYVGQQTNRNVISIICCQGGSISNVQSSGVGRAELQDQGFGIDLEPNEPDEYIRDMRITNVGVIGSVPSVAAAAISASARNGPLIDNILFSDIMVTYGFVNAIQIKGHQLSVPIKNISILNARVKGYGYIGYGIYLQNVEGIVDGCDVSGATIQNYYATESTVTWGAIK